jgi:hypothetical protein
MLKSFFAAQLFCAVLMSVVGLAGASVRLPCSVSFERL